jgi:PAS domain S-box-containing protein
MLHAARARHAGVRRQSWVGLGCAKERRDVTGATVHERDPASFLDGRERWVWATLEAIGDAVISTDAEGVVTFMNGAAEVLTGWTRGDATGKKIDEILELADPSGQPIEGRVRAAVLQGCSVRVPTPTSLLARAGDRVVDHRVSPVVDATGAVVGGVVILRDVTERTKFERRLAQTEGLASVGTMAAGMVHEINNPLAYVISNVGFCLEGLEEVIESLRRLTVAKPQRTALDGALARLGELTQALDDASEGADRVRRIVADLERFTHVEDGESQIVDVAGILEAAAKLTANALRHHAQLRKDYGRTPLVEANPGQLTQVFTNLLLNAFEAIGHGHAEHHEIRMTTSTDGAGRAVVEIHDTGPGIPADVLPHIFDPFFTTKPSGAGMGLGLSICQRVIVACGGEIAAESVPGHGTTFRVTLPQARGDGGAQSEALHVPGTAPARRARVLVIDDDRAVAASMARLLGLHHAVTTETDPRAALDAIARGELYDVIFCDLMMPNISGIDFYDALTASAPDQARRIVFMTGGAFSPQARGFLEKVPNTSLTKPFTLESIQAIVGLAVAVDVEVVASGPPEEPQG